MSLSVVVSLFMAGSVLAFWCVLTLDRERSWPGSLRLDQVAEPPRVDAASGVLAIVPARDEAEHLPLTLPALLAQSFRGQLDVMVVDDGSSDVTAALAARLLALGGPCVGRTEALLLRDKPTDWSGKVNAQARGLAQATAAWGTHPWLLLCDADIRLRPGALADLLAVAGADLDLVSVMARLRCRSFWERLLVPPFVFFFQLLYPFRSVADASSPVAAAAGGCMLVRRDVFERAGGFAAISRELIDDVGLAKAIAAVGGRLWLGLDAGIESVRAYSSLASLWRMVARNAFVQLHYSFALLSATLIGLLWFFVLPLPLALWAAASWWRQGHPLALLAALAFFASWILQTRALMPAVLHHRAGRVFAGTLWLAAGFYAGMTLHAALSYLGGRASSWKGRAYAR